MSIPFPIVSEKIASSYSIILRRKKEVLNIFLTSELEALEHQLGNCGMNASRSSRYSTHQTRQTRIAHVFVLSLLALCGGRGFVTCRVRVYVCTRRCTLFPITSICCCCRCCSQEEKTVGRISFFVRSFSSLYNALTAQTKLAAAPTFLSFFLSLSLLFSSFFFRRAEISLAHTQPTGSFFLLPSFVHSFFRDVPELLESNFRLP